MPSCGISYVFISDSFHNCNPRQLRKKFFNSRTVLQNTVTMTTETKDKDYNDAFDLICILLQIYTITYEKILLKNQFLQNWIYQ